MHGEICDRRRCNKDKAARDSSAIFTTMRASYVTQSSTKVRWISLRKPSCRIAKDDLAA